MKKVKRIWQTLREWWKVPRYRSLMILGFYAIFFTGVFIYIDSIRPSYEQGLKKDPLTSYIEMNNYEYEYTIQEGEETYHLLGTRYQSKERFRLKETGEVYTVLNEQIQGEVGSTELNELFSFSLFSLTPKRLGTVLKEIEPITTTTYQDGITKKEYRVTEQALGLSSIDRVVTVTTLENRTHLFDITLESTISIHITYDNIDNIQGIDE